MGTEKTEVRRGTKYLIRIVAGVVILVSSVLLLGNLYKTEKISVEGLTYYTEADFLNKISSETARKNTLLFRLEQFRNGEQRVPYIERYDVKTEGKNELKILVYEKILTGCVKVMGQYLYFDKDGYVTESSVEQLPGIPVVKGLEFDRIVLYLKILCRGTNAQKRQYAAKYKVSDFHFVFKFCIITLLGVAFRHTPLVGYYTNAGGALSEHPDVWPASSDGGR